MTRNNEDTSLTDIVVMDPVVAQQNELIAQLVQQIAEMREEIQKNRELLNPAIAANTHSTSYQAPPYLHNTNPQTYPPSPQNPYPISYVQPSYQTPPPNYLLPHNQNAPLGYQIPRHPNFQTSAPTRRNHLNYHQVLPPPRNNHPNFEKKPSRVFTPLIESRTQLFERLKATGMIQTIDPENINANSKLYKPDLYCAYHSGGAGHITEACINLKHKIQDLIDQKVVTFQTAAPNVDNNPHQAVALEPKKGQNKRKADHAPSKPFPHVYQSFSVRKCDNNVGLGEGVRNLFKESDDVMIEASDIRNANPKEPVPN